jgi:hypothetical protein
MDLLSCSGCGRPLAPHERFCAACGRPRPADAGPPQIVDQPAIQYASPPAPGTGGPQPPSPPPAAPGAEPPSGSPPPPGPQPPPQPYGQAYPPPPARPAGGGQWLALASLVLGIISLVTWWIYPPVGLPIAGVGLGLGVGGRHSPAPGLAVGGIATSSVGLGLTVAGYIARVVLALRS